MVIVDCTWSLFAQPVSVLTIISRLYTEGRKFPLKFTVNENYSPLRVNVPRGTLHGNRTLVRTFNLIGSEKERAKITIRVEDNILSAGSSSRAYKNFVISFHVCFRVRGEKTEKSRFIERIRWCYTRWRGIDIDDDDDDGVR